MKKNKESKEKSKRKNLPVDFEPEINDNEEDNDTKNIKEGDIIKFKTHHPVSSWKRNVTDEEDNSAVSTHLAYQHYRKHAESLGRTPHNEANFQSHMRKLGVQKARIGGRERYIGLSLKGGLHEALGVAARRKAAQKMLRMVRKLVVARKKARARFAPEKNLKLRAQKLARSIFRKRKGGQRGQDYANLGMADKIAIDKMIDKSAPAIRKMVKRLMPAVRRAEANRLASVRAASSNKNDQRHKRKFHGSVQ